MFEKLSVGRTKTITNLFDDEEKSEEIENEFSDDEKDEEDPEWNDDFFPFRVEDEYIVVELIKLVRGIIAERHLSPYQLRQIAVVLYALEHLPRRVEGIAIGLSVVYRLNEESSYCDFYISESEFRLSSGGCVYDPGVGGDSYGDSVFEAETSGFRAGDSESAEVFGWFGKVQELLNMEAKIEFENNGDDSEIDWHEEPNQDDWNELFELNEKLGY